LTEKTRRAACLAGGKKPGCFSLKKHLRCLLMTLILALIV
jgi:hypothetical protein